MSKTDDAAIAAFMATRGVTRVAEGAAVDALGREFWVNGLGEWIATE